MERNYTPGSREVAAGVVKLWKEDDSTSKLSYAKLLAKLKELNPTWSLSEKRMKQCLKEFNLGAQEPAFHYVKETRTVPNYDLVLPSGVKLQMTKSRGQGLFTTMPFKKGDILWKEEPLVQAPPLEMLRLMRAGRCCAYCATPLRAKSVACITCTGNWCGFACKRADFLHVDTFHLKGSRIRSSIWKEYEQFCLENGWKAGLLYGLTMLKQLKLDGTRRGFSEMSKNIAAMATIRQDVRQKAVSQPGSLEFEQLEQMWHEGFKLFSAVIKPVSSITYEQYMEGIGMVNINNVDGCLFATHSRLNHSCEPNLSVEVVGKVEGVVVRANNDIKAGQELTVTYFNPELQLAERESLLLQNWGFSCGCNRCKQERRAPDGVADEKVNKNSNRQRAKSVHFEKNPVSHTIEIPAST